MSASSADRAHERTELGAFLRTHREATRAPLGSQGSHRRAAWLRRSEVASLVGISEQWYTLMEQGRAMSVSSQVLVRLADVFALSPAETEHLFTLAGKQLPDGLRAEDSEVPAPMRRFLDAQSPCPAYIIDHHWDALAWNDAADVLLYDLGALPPRRRNILLQIFTDPETREKMAGWEAVAKTVLAFFRGDYGRNPNDPRIRDVVAELNAKSEEFREWWPLQEVDDHVSVRMSYVGVGGATLEFDRLTFISAENLNLRVVVLIPVPNTDTARLAARLVAEHRGRPPGTTGQ